MGESWPSGKPMLPAVVI